MYQLQSATNEATKSLMDSMVELNALKFTAEQNGWSVTFSVLGNGDVAVNLSREEWPTLEDFQKESQP